MTIDYPSIRGNTCDSGGKNRCLIWRSRWRCFETSQVQDMSTWEDVGAAHQVRAPSYRSKQVQLPPSSMMFPPSMASRSHPPGCCRPCSICWFHPRIAWLKPPAGTKPCAYLVISSTSDHHIPRFPWSPHKIHMKSIWNPYVHGRRRSSLLVADCLVVVWNKSYGILEVHLARRHIKEHLSAA